MHPNPVFRKATDCVNLEFAAERGFGTLAVNADPAPLLTHIPFVLDQDTRTVDLHLVRSNPIVPILKSPQNVVISVTGPDSYVSPDWYNAPNLVPTWNYVAVHLRGTLTRLPQAQLATVLNRLSENFETRLLPKPVWTSDKVDPESLAKMMRILVPFRLEISNIQGTWKLGQNKPTAARSSSASAVSADGIGQETTALANLMRNPPTT